MSVDFFCSLWSCVQCDCLICCLFALSVSSGDQVDHLGLCVGVCVIVVVFFIIKATSVLSSCIELQKVDFTVVLVLFLIPNPSLSLYFQTDKSIFGYTYANFVPPLISTPWLQC